MSLKPKIPGSSIVAKGHWREVLENLNREKARKKRIPLAGYPWTGKFKTSKEIKAYFDGDKIQCLLCGRWFRGLGNHVLKIHEITADEYKTRFGLPYNRGLSSKKYHDAHSRTQKELYKQGVNPLIKEELRLKGSAIAKKETHKRRLNQPFNKLRQKETHKYSSSSTSILAKDKVLAVLRRAKRTNRTIKDVCKDSDMPSSTTFYKWLKRYNTDNELITLKLNKNIKNDNNII